MNKPRIFQKSAYELSEQTSGSGINSLTDLKTYQNALRKFGGFMVGMIMPVIGIIIAWGFATAILLGIKTAQIGGNPTAAEAAAWSASIGNMDGIIGFGINTLVPLMIGYMGGRQVYGRKGAIIGIIATMGTIMGSFNPLFNQTMAAMTGNNELLEAPAPAMILGAMIAGPLAAKIFKMLEKLWVDRIPSGFEMLVNNFSIGLVGLAVLLGSYWTIALLAAVLQAIFYLIINGINGSNTLFLLPIFVEVEKVLFLNNAVNHGILGPLGYAQVDSLGQSAFFYLDPNPGTGMGLLIAYFMFSNKQDKAQSLAAMPVHFIGGIHEVYYPFVLTKPLNLLWMICGGMFAAGMYQAFDVGALFTPSPGSIIMNYLATNPAHATNYIGLTIAIFGSMAITFSLTSLTLVLERLNRGERVYFNPKVASRMGQISRWMDVRGLLEINNANPIASVSYNTVKTGTQEEWEIIKYVDGGTEEFINLSDKTKITNFHYEEAENKFGKMKTYLVKEFASGKSKRVVMRSFDRKMAEVNYQFREIVDKTRTITFKPELNKHGVEVTPKPLVEKVWYLNPEESMADLSVSKEAGADTVNLNQKHEAIIKNAKKIIFACEAGMGSSAMGAGIVRKLLKAQGVTDLLVVNSAIKDLPPNCDTVIITQKTFKDLVEKAHPNAYVYLIDQFLEKKEYDQIIKEVKKVRG